MSLIFEKIPLVMAEIGAIGKDRQNAQQGYKFRGIDDLYNAANAALTKHGVFTVPLVLDMKREERQTQKGGTLLYTILTVKYLFYATDGSFFEAITVGEAMDSGDKSCNKAMSAAQKYALLQVFAIPTEEPKDTEHETHEVKPKEKPLPDKKPAEKDSDKPNYAFLKAMGEQKERVGNELYYKSLGFLGYEKSNEISNREHQVELYNMLLAIPDKQEKK